jgi:hypothetical protein
VEIRKSHYDTKIRLCDVKFKDINMWDVDKIKDAASINEVDDNSIIPKLASIEPYIPRNNSNNYAL